MRIGVNAMPMRVWGGGARYAFMGLMRRLIELDDRNEYLIFGHLLGLHVLQKLPGVSRHLHWSADPRKRIRLVTLESEEQIFDHRDDFDLFFGPLNNLQPRIYDRPTVAILHDIQEQFFPEYFSESDLRARNEIYPEIARSATTLVTVSRFCRDSIVEKFRIDPARVEVVYNAPQPELTEAADNDHGCWKRDPIAEPFLYYPANCYPHKNHRLLLDALEVLQSQSRPSPSVVFTGFELPGGFPLSPEIRRRGLAHCCRVFAELDVAELRYLYRHALAVVLPTKFEGFCMPAIEAMSCGCPVICSELPALREVAGHNALYFEPDDVDGLVGQIGRITRDRPLREKLVDSGRAHARGFSWDRSARDMLRIFEEAARRFLGSPVAAVPADRIPTPRIGVLINATRNRDIRPALQNILATGYPQIALRILSDHQATDGEFLSPLEHKDIPIIAAQSGESASLNHLEQFAADENLDLVGELVAGHAEFLPTAFHSLLWSLTDQPDKFVFLGEVWERRKERIEKVARLRLMGDGLWRLEGFLYPEMMFLDRRAFAWWRQEAGAGDAAAHTGSNGDARQNNRPTDPSFWRWHMVRDAFRADRLALVRRSLAVSDPACVSFRDRIRAAQQGLPATYQGAGHVARRGWLRSLEPVLRATGRVLPRSLRAKGKRVYDHLTS